MEKRNRSCVDTRTSPTTESFRLPTVLTFC